MKGFSQGGLVSGEGSSDSVPAMLTKGEYRVSAEAYRKYGPDLEKLLRNRQSSFVVLEDLDDGEFAPMPHYTLSMSAWLAAAAFLSTFLLGLGIGYALAS